MRALFLTIGDRVTLTPDAYETRAAIEAGLQVRSELHGRSRLTSGTQQ
jgi:hypothetical protein